MESVCQGKKFQSSWELSPTTSNLVRKDCHVNPYNRSMYSSSWMSPKWPHVDANDNGNDGAVSGLMEFECGVLANSYMDACSCCRERDTNEGSPSEEVTVTRPRECCKENWTRKEIYRKIKEKVENAVRGHKIFLIRGEMPRLKAALEARGWVQKYETTRTRMLPYGTTPNLEARSLGEVTQADGTLNERAVIFALLCYNQPDFIWDCRNDFVDWHHGLSCNVLLNRYQKPHVYTSKLGMARLLENVYWLYEENVSSVLFPRSYNVSEDQQAFLEDFRFTAAVGLLKWFVHGMNVANEIFVSDPARRAIPIARLEFALKRCEEFIAVALHEDIDVLQNSQSSDEQWDLFLKDYTAILHDRIGIENSSHERIQSCFLTASTTLEKLKTIDPQYEMSGVRDIWILKPSDLCCGAGIVMSHDLNDILSKVEEKPTNYYIVQKYIENPLLIKETKFDIRLWYLVTSTFPLTIWLFREALLRFSSKPYSFTTYHEAIHICNTAIQERYNDERRRRYRRKQNSTGDFTISGSVRDQKWDCGKLNEYLKSIGHAGEPYYDLIYPKMAEAIVLMMLAAQDHMEKRRCSFELYGADFVVAADMSVWLIEINTNPRMHPPSSSLTKRLYTDVQESLVKVIMDLPMNPRADTGGFSLIYKQNVSDVQPSYPGPCLLVTGKSMIVHRQKSKKEKGANSWDKQQRARTAPAMLSRSREPIVIDFIEHLNAVRCTAAN